MAKSDGVKVDALLINTEHGHGLVAVETTEVNNSSTIHKSPSWNMFPKHIN